MPSAQAETAGAINQVDGVALHGFDPVAYFTQHKAVKGEPQFTAVHDGVTYEFASKEDQATFQTSPEKYVPQYGGYCAIVFSKGVKADIDPHAFAIDDGKLYVNYSEPALQARGFQANKGSPLAMVVCRRMCRHRRFMRCGEDAAVRRTGAEIGQA